MKQTIHFKDKIILIEGTRKVYPFINEIITQSQAQPSKQFDVTSIPFFAYSKNNNTHWCIGVSSLEEFSPSLNQAIKNNILNTIPAFIKDHEKQIQEAMQSKNIPSIFHHMTQIMKTAIYLRRIDRAVAHHFKNHNDLQTLCYPSTPTKTYSIEKELNELSSSSNQKKIKDIYKEYRIINTGYFRNTIPSLDEFKEILNEKPHKDLREKALEQQKILMSKLSPNDKKIAKIGAKSAYLKDLYKYTFSKILGEIETLLQEISNNANISIEELKHYTLKNIITTAKTKKKQNSLPKTYCFSTTGNGIKIYENKKAEEWQLLFQENKKTNIFKGRIACKGKVTGYVKIIKESSNFKKFKKGDILVTTNTSPDFIPLLRKAKAIVGEEGGITAHISVISREMEIPCITGINNITTLLKDGDHIEVDATSGIVKIIEKK